MAKNKITLKQVLNNIKDMDEKHKVEWVYSLLKEFGSEVTSVGMINATYVSQCHLYNYARMSDASKLRTYFVSDKNQENFLSAWLNGYAVKNEKYYFVAVPVGRGYYKRVTVYSDYTLGLGDHNYMSLDKLKQHSRQACYQITEDMIKESSLSWAWQFAKELEDY